jgi:hypothetical protein
MSIFLWTMLAALAATALIEVAGCDHRGQDASQA